MVDLVWIPADQPKLDVERWEWPMAMYSGKFRKHAAYIVCETPFSPLAVRTGNHLPIRVVIRRYNDPRDSLNDGFRMLCSEKFSSIELAILFVQTHLEKHPEWCPRII